MSTDDLNSLSKDYISKVLNESISLQQKINNRYLDIKNNKNAKLTLKSEFSEKIEDFRNKYKYNSVAIINTKTNEVINFDVDCSNKIKEISEYLENYIDKNY